MRNSREIHKAKIQKACEEIRANPGLKILTVAWVHGLNNHTLANHLHGHTKYHSEAHESQQILSQAEEKQIGDWIQALDDQGTPARRRHVRDMVDFLLREHEDLENEQLGIHWTEWYLKRHPEISFKVARPINKDRALAQEPVRINGFYNRLGEVRSRYKIIDDDVWNSDEKGFAIGLAIGGKVFCRSGRRNSHLVQDGGREWVTLVETVSATGGVTPPFLVYAAKSQRESWHDYVDRDEATFSISDTGYMHHRLSLKWLKEHFEKFSQPSSPTAHRLLILDNHSSHQDFDFYHYCLEHRIHLLFFPSHLTPVLQPLDQNPFGMIGRFYRQQVDEFYRVNGPYSTIHKGDFFPLLQQARQQSLTKANVRASFHCTGIVPLNRSRVLVDSGLQLSVNPSRSIPHDLRPGPSRNTNSTQVHQLRLELVNATSLGEAQRIGQDLARLAEGASAASAIATKTLNDQLAKRQPSKAKAGGIITRAEVIGRKALDKAYKEKLARKEKAKLAAERKRKRTDDKNTRPQKRPNNRPTNTLDHGFESEGQAGVGDYDEGIAGDIQEELGTSSDEEEVGDCHMTDVENPNGRSALGEPPGEEILGEISSNIRQNPPRGARYKLSFRKLLLGE